MASSNFYCFVSQKDVAQKNWNKIGEKPEKVMNSFMRDLRLVGYAIRLQTALLKLLKEIFAGEAFVNLTVNKFLVYDLLPAIVDRIIFYRNFNLLL